VEQLRVLESFHRQDRMAVGGLPVGAKALTTQGQSAGDQIGQLPRLGEQQKTGFVGDEV
jgi:hypothetical protein